MLLSRSQRPRDARAGPRTQGDPDRAPRAPPAERPTRGDALWDLLGDCHREMRAELRAVVLRHGVHLGEYRALAGLRRGPRTLSQLAEGLGLTPASMTDLARQLEKRRWVERRPNPADRRSQLLESTGRGRAVYLAARREYRSRLAEVYSELSPSSRRALERGLDGLGRVLAARAGEHHGPGARGPGETVVAVPPPTLERPARPGPPVRGRREGAGAR
jgi:DNA-binding MarR family transcriptional regulator